MAKQAEIPNTLPLDQVRMKLCEALKALMPDATYPALSIIEQLYPDRAIVRDAEGTLWAYPYTIGEGEAVLLGERQAVRIEYVARQAVTHQRILQALDKQGWEWEVLVIKPGLGANSQYFPAETLQAAAPLFEGARVFCLDDAQHSKTGDKSAKQIVGWIDQARYVAGQGILGVLHLMPTADWLRANLMASHEKGKPDLYGLSIHARGEAVVRQVKELGDKAVQWFTKFVGPATVDVVWDPGTPGGFQRALNAHLTPEEDPMKERLLKILQAKRPDLLAGKDQAVMTEEELLALVDQASSPAPAATVKQASGLSEDERSVIQQARVLHWNAQAAARITESKLPEIMQASLRKRFLDALPAEGVEKGQAQITQAIEEERRVYDALSPQGKVAGLGYVHQAEVEGNFERLQAAMDKLFGIKDVKSDAPAFAGIRQAYEYLTGDEGVTGHRSIWTPERAAAMARAAQAFQANVPLDGGRYPLPGFVRIAQAQASASWPLILGNTLARRLAQDYAEVDYQESLIVSNKRRANDFRNLEIVRPQYPADLPTVDPENADYTERAALTEEGVSYAITTRGRIVSITRKTVLNDDIGAVIRTVKHEGRAARRTHAQVIWNLFINNATYDGDSKAWFHADHGNLGSVALTANSAGVTEMVAALNRLMAQTEPGSGKKLAGSWKRHKITLVVPPDIQDKAYQLNQSKGIPGGSNEGDNPVYAAFGNPENPERIIVNPLFTDASDWGLFRDPQEIEIIEVAYLLGQEQPEVFVADQQQIGQMFLADKTQFKIRHEYAAELSDFRGAEKNVVA